MIYRVLYYEPVLVYLFIDHYNICTYSRIFKCRHEAKLYAPLCNVVYLYGLPAPSNFKSFSRADRQVMKLIP